MDIETATNESIEQELLHREAVIARVRATQLVLLREVDRRQLPMGAGCGSLGEWVRGRLDVSPETARDLVATAKHLEELPDVEEAIETGEIGFDRAVAVGRFARRDDTFDILNEMAGFDIAGIRNRAARRRRMTRVDEETAYNDRYLNVQPNLDESLWRLNGRLPGFAGKIVIDALEAKADTFPKGPGHVSRAARNADALWAISLDALYGTDGASIEDPTPVLTVFVDANEAAATNGEAGVVVQGGPRVGEAAIEAILCDGIIEVTARTSDGTPLRYGTPQPGPSHRSCVGSSWIVTVRHAPLRAARAGIGCRCITSNAGSTVAVPTRRT